MFECLIFSFILSNFCFTEDEPDANLPYLGAEEAVEEVMTLLARLENDRQETEKKLDHEKERVLRLGAKIDYHCQRRMKELPEVVQKGRHFTGSCKSRLCVNENICLF